MIGGVLPRAGLAFSAVAPAEAAGRPSTRTGTYWVRTSRLGLGDILTSGGGLGGGDAACGAGPPGGLRAPYRRLNSAGPSSWIWLMFQSRRYSSSVVGAAAVGGCQEALAP